MWFCFHFQPKSEGQFEELGDQVFLKSRVSQAFVPSNQWFLNHQKAMKEIPSVSHTFVYRICKIWSHGSFPGGGHQWGWIKTGFWTWRCCCWCSKLFNLHPWTLEPQGQPAYKWMDVWWFPAICLCNDLVHHPIETYILNGSLGFQVNINSRFNLKSSGIDIGKIIWSKPAWLWVPCSRGVPFPRQDCCVWRMTRCLQ